MGVRQLWDLVGPFGVPTSPETWAGKRIAIDASIWVEQFRRVAPKTASTADECQLVLEGFLRRLLRLMYFGVLPVVVFDGPAPALKRREQMRRQLAHEATVERARQRKLERLLILALTRGEVAGREAMSLEEAEALVSDASLRKQAADALIEIAPQYRSIDDVTGAVKRPKATPQRQVKRRPVRTDSATPRGTRTGTSNRHPAGNERDVQDLHDCLDDSATLARRSETRRLRLLNLFAEIRREEEATDRVAKNNLVRSHASFLGPASALLPRREASDHRAVVTSVQPADGGTGGGLAATAALDEDWLNELEDQEGALQLLQSETRLRLRRRNSRNSCGSHARFSVDVPSDAEAASVDLGDGSIDSDEVVSVETVETSMRSEAESLPSSASSSISVWSGASSSSRCISVESVTTDFTAARSSTEDSNDNCGDDEEGDAEASWATIPPRRPCRWPLPRRAEQTSVSVATVDDSSSVCIIDIVDRDRSLSVSESPAGIAVPATVAAAAVPATPRSPSARSVTSTTSTSSVAQKSGTASLQRHSGVDPATRRAWNQGYRVQPQRDDGAGHRVPLHVAEVVELLDALGIAWLVAPSEADATCGFLSADGHVDAVMTEDSDVFLFGAVSVIRGFFGAGSTGGGGGVAHTVMHFSARDLDAVGLSRTNLIGYALLMGSDYTAGVKGVTLDAAVQCLIGFADVSRALPPPLGGGMGDRMARTFAGLVDFSASLRMVTGDSVVVRDDDEPFVLAMARWDAVRRVRLGALDIVPPPAFPSVEVATAYLAPSVAGGELDNHGNPRFDFYTVREVTQGAPDSINWMRVRDIAAVRCGWSHHDLASRIDAVHDRCVRRAEAVAAARAEGSAAVVGTQRRIDAFAGFRALPAAATDWARRGLSAGDRGAAARYGDDAEVIFRRVEESYAAPPPTTATTTAAVPQRQQQSCAWLGLAAHYHGLGRNASRAVNWLRCAVTASRSPAHTGLPIAVDDDIV